PPPIPSVSTTLPGANPQVVETAVTDVLEEELSTIQGLRTLSSSSSEENSQITLEFNLDRAVDVAAQDVRDKVSRVRGRLPVDVLEPVIAKQEADAQPFFWLALSSPNYDLMQLSEDAAGIRGAGRGESRRAGRQAQGRGEGRARARGQSLDLPLQRKSRGRHRRGAAVQGEPHRRGTKHSRGHSEHSGDAAAGREARNRVRWVRVRHALDQRCAPDTRDSCHPRRADHLRVPAEPAGDGDPRARDPG